MLHYKNYIRECIKKNMPSEVPGVAFLSGGQSELEATKNLIKGLEYE